MNTSYQEAVHNYRTRSALEELPSTYEGSPVVATPSNIPDNNATTPQATIADVSLISASPSPDEIIIRDRGRRSLPVKWSPIPIASPQKISDRFPLKRSAAKGLLALRSSPRKKLQLTDSFEMEHSRQALLESSLLFRDQSLRQLPKIFSPEEAIRGLSQSQLVDVLSSIFDKHPEIKDEVSKLLPLPDLKNMEEELLQCKKSVLKSLPASRLTSKTDSPAYCRALPHINAMKKLLQNHCKKLLDLCQWDSLLNYCFLAWIVVRSTPVWDLTSHNNMTRRACFKILSHNCLLALKNSDLKNEDEMDIINKQLNQCTADSEEMKMCQEFLRNRLNNNSA